MVRPPDLQAALAETAAMYRRCLVMTSELIEKAGVTDETRLASLLAERAALLDRVYNIEEGMLKAFGPRLWDENGPAASHPDEISKIRRLAGELLEADRKLNDHLKRELDDARGEISKTGRGRIALKKYTPYRRGQRPVLLDRKG